MLGKIEGRSRRGWQRMRWLDGSPTKLTWVWVDSGSWWWTGRPGMLWFMGSQSQTRLSDWTELNWFLVTFFYKRLHSRFFMLQAHGFCLNYSSLLLQLSASIDNTGTNGSGCFSVKRHSQEHMATCGLLSSNCSRLLKVQSFTKLHRGLIYLCFPSMLAFSLLLSDFCLKIIFLCFP